MGSCQMLSAPQVATALVAAPVSSTRARPEELAAPVALFQWLLEITPAYSELPIGTSEPTKSMLIALLKPEDDEETFSVAVVECINAPLVAVIVKTELPVGVLPEVVTVSEEVPDELMLVGEKAAVAPEGNPLTPRETVPVNPTFGVIVMA